jgi:hypothetical protein
MAVFIATTACNTPKCKEGASEQLEKILERFEITCEVEISICKEGYLHFYGYDWPSVCRAEPDNENEDWDDSDCLEEFLCGLAPLLEEALIVHAVGAEKCRFPLAGSSWTVYPDGQIVCHHLPAEACPAECGKAAA